MNLWSLHTPNHNLTKGRVDHNRSEYYCDVPGVKEAYFELWRRIDAPTGQIIWCYTRNIGIPKTGTIKILWELDVPEDSIVCFLDNPIWNQLLEEPRIDIRRQCWDKLFVDGRGESVDAILHHPIPDIFVKNKITWGCKSTPLTRRD